MKSKLLLNAVVVSLLMTSCGSVTQIGKVNMIANRNVDPNAKYQAISTYSGGSTKELKKSTATSIEDAVDQTVKKVPGGEFLMNTKVYVINKKYIAVEGDVWGLPSEKVFRGFKQGDRVTWKNKSILNNPLGSAKYLKGTISALKDDKTCLVQVDNVDNKTVSLSYDEITIIK